MIVKITNSAIALVAELEYAQRLGRCSLRDCEFKSHRGHFLFFNFQLSYLFSLYPRYFYSQNAVF